MKSAVSTYPSARTLTHGSLAASAAALGLALLAVLASPAAQGQGTKPAAAAPAGQADQGYNTRTASLPARGLFRGDQLTPEARSRLSELILDVIGRQVEIALVVPSGPWNLEGSGSDERDLTSARLDNVRRFLAERGIDRNRILVESRIDDKLTEPRLDVQVVSKPASD